MTIPISAEKQMLAVLTRVTILSLFSLTNYHVSITILNNLNLEIDF